MSGDLGAASFGLAAGRSDDDQAFLDCILDESVRAIEDGRSVDASRAVAARPDLRSRIEEVLRRAADIAVSPAVSMPYIRGYRLLRLLGRGGMGTVYLAQQERLGGRLVALKILPAASALTPGARQRFRAEAAAIGRLQHPNIVTVHDVVEQDGVCAFAMEWVDGATLASTIEQARVAESSLHAPPAGTGIPRDPAALCRVGIAVARALSVVHAAGLLHRDIKPSNILIRHDGTPLLSDFGLARETDTTITRPGLFVGTVAYAPPEQLRGEIDKLDQRSDVYSLGITLYHALTLSLPFKGSNPAAILRDIDSGRFVLPRQLNPRITVDLQTIVTKAMDADPVQRYQTAAELADDLERLLSLQPICARPAGLATRAIKLVRRNRGVFVTGAAATALTLGLCIAAVVWWFFVPRWVEGNVRDARLALLDANAANSIISVLYWNSHSRPGVAQQAERNQRLDGALRAYAAAIRLAPFDEPLRREMSVVRAARGGQPSPHDDLRSLGLHAFLIHEYRGAIDAWSRWEKSRDPLAQPDPLVDAALGVLYLFDEQPARAYPRLQKAVEAFPEVGFLLEYLADAAAKCGDAERARRWLEQSKRLPRRDLLGAGDRILAAILAAEGRTTEAVAAYRGCMQTGLPQLELAQLLDREGRWEEALREYRAVLGRFAGSARLGSRFRLCAENWWKSLSSTERLRRVRAALDESPHASDSFAGLVRAYVAADPRVGREESVPATSRVFPLSSALLDPFSSPSLQSLSLPELAERMEVTNMTNWSRLQQLPAILKNWQAQAWFAARETAATRMVAWISPVYSAVSEQVQQLAKAARSRSVSRAVSAGTVVATASTIHAQTPSVQYLFDEGTASTTNNSGSLGPAANGIVNGPMWSTDTRSGAGFSLFFDGADDRLEVPNAIAYGGQITVEAWIKPDNVSGFHVVWDDYGQPGVLLAVINGGLQWSVSTAEHPVAGVSAYGGAVVAGEWQHVAGTYDGTRITAYVNGCAVRSVATSGAIVDNLNNFPSGVGSDNPPNPPALLFHGVVDDFRIYSVALPVGQLAAGAFGPTPPCFQGLGDLPGGPVESSAIAISADGTTVVGNSKSTASGGNPEAFRWRVETGLMALGDLPGGGYFSVAEDVSGVGGTVVGSSYSGTADWPPYPVEGFRWTEAVGMSALGDASGSYFFSQANSVSDDGQVVGGQTIVGPGDPNAGDAPPCRWVAGAGPMPLTGTGSETYGVAWGMSGDGTVLVGSRAFGTSTSIRAFRWSESGGLQDLGDLPGGTEFASLTNANLDGSVCVGYGQSTNGREAIRWDAVNGILGIGDFAGGSFDSVASSVSPDGRFIVGYGSTPTGAEAALWDSSLNISRVVDVLSSAGISIPAGWTLHSANDITINGNVVTIVGNATNPAGNPEAWIARYTLPQLPCPGDVNGDRIVDLSDLAVLLANFGTASGATLANGDLDADGDVELADLALLLANFGTTCR